MAIKELKPYLSNIAEKLKSLLGITDKINAQDFVEKIEEVYEQGKKSQYDEFWNGFQRNGESKSYAYAFYAWREEIYNPKFDIKPTSATNMFYSTTIKDIYKNGILIDFSFCGVFTNCFSYSEKIERLGVLDFRKGTTTASSSVFSYCKALHTIEELILNDSGTQTFSSWFSNATALENVTITGVIGKSISFSNSSKLTYESLISIINALKDYSGTSYDGTYKLTLSTSSKTLLEEQGNVSPNGNTWIDYIGDKGWNI